MLSLNELKMKVESLAAKLEAPHSFLPTFGKTEDGARPHIESDGFSYHYVVVERGIELKRKTTTEIDELFYWTFSSVTFSMACSFELMHRVEGKDFRRILFAKQEELLGILSSDWAERERKSHIEILSRHPFRD